VARKTENFIDDGYTEQGYIAEAPLVHTAVRFEFRPALSHERAEVHHRKVFEMPPEKRFALYAREVEKRIAKWDLTCNGEPLPIKAAKAVRIKPDLLEKLINVITGVAPSDVDPEWSDEEVLEQTDSEMEALLSDQTIGDAKAELWLWDFETGKIRQRLGVDQKRPAGTPTPCGTCPKKSPAEARHYELSRRNIKTFRIWEQVQATRGACLTPAMRRDTVLLRNLVIVDNVVRAAENEVEANVFKAMDKKRRE
jgi:hypothetical protein